MSILLRCMIAAFLVAVAVGAAIGTYQYVRCEYYLSTQYIWQEGTTRPDQLTANFTRRFWFGRFINMGNYLTDAQRERFWLGNWSNLGTSWLGWPVEWITLIGGLGCVFALGPILAAATEPRFRRAFTMNNRPDKRSALSIVRSQTVRHVSWIVICCTPLAWWLLIDLEANFDFGLVPWIRFGPLSITGVLLPVAIGAYWSIGLARIFARRVALRSSGNLGLCAACGYDCTGQARCPECGLAVGSAATSRDRRTIVRLAAAFCIGVGVLALLPGSSSSLWLSWRLFQGHRPVSPMIFARPHEVLEITCGDETILVAWRVEFLPPVGRQAVPDSVVSAVLELESGSESPHNVRVERLLAGVWNTSGSMAYQLNIPSGPAQLRSGIQAFEARPNDAFGNTMIGLECSGVSNVRRWDPQSDDPDIRKVVAALEAVPRGTGQPDTTVEGESQE